MKDGNSLLDNKIKRTFIAINLDSNIKNTLNNIQKNILTGESKIKWVSPKHLHITLEFLGDQSLGQIEIIRQLLKKITVCRKSFIISLSSNISVFPSFKKPCVIWVGIENGTIKLKKLSELIKSSLLKNLLLKDDKEFHSHITIGRVKYLTDKNILLNSINEINLKRKSQKINSIELMESKLTPTGPIYSIIERFPLVNH
ncbi:MAG: RNA 2',3'-cyclic phosphodiesterase [Candidatus Caldatribacteriota bacterium]|nr:RNA 2',3'-cyclic phosphodiesterase [Candidatus Caldatribacteriota bacterium]